MQWWFIVDRISRRKRIQFASFYSNWNWTSLRWFSGVLFHSDFSKNWIRWRPCVAAILPCFSTGQRFPAKMAKVWISFSYYHHKLPLKHSQPLTQSPQGQEQGQGICKPFNRTRELVTYFVRNLWVLVGFFR